MDAEPPANSATAEQKTALVLVVDDEVDLLQSYERLLRRAGYEVLTAQRAQEGLTIAESKHVALVIVDLRLPDMDGIALVRALRARRDPPLVIVITGFPSAATRQAALDAGAAGYLAKPFSVLALTALLRNLLGTSET
jgi:DNA-binding response OmpR family regulator